MVLLISLLFTALIAAGRGTLRRRAGQCYALSTLVSCMVIAGVWSGRTQSLTGIAALLANVFLQGGLAGALFIAVMYAGALPEHSALRRAIMPVRGQLSIIACILTFGHNIAFGKTYFVRLFTQAEALKTQVLLAALCSIVMIALLLPLFVTSFLCVRRRMQPRRWKRLQRLAYVFYALMYVHVLLLNMTGAREGKAAAILNIALYSLLYFVYASLRIGKALQKHQHEGWNAAVQLGCTALLVGVLVMVLMPAGQGSIQTASAYAEPAAWKDGRYKGAAIGYNGRLTVSVTVQEGRLQKIACTGHVEDEPYITDAENGLFAAMIDGNTTQVDAVSGATTTSDALIEAVREALKGAE